MPGLSSGLSSLFDRYTRPEADEDGERLRDESADRGADRIGECRDRGRYELRGVLTSITVPPEEGHPHLTAELFDGSGYLTLVWMGRHTIPGIGPGVRLRVQGRVMMKDGAPVMYNPTFDVVATTASGRRRRRRAARRAASGATSGGRAAPGTPTGRDH